MSLLNQRQKALVTKAMDSVPSVGGISRKECALDATKTSVLAVAWGATKSSAGLITMVIVFAQNALSNMFAISKVTLEAGTAQEAQGRERYPLTTCSRTRVQPYLRAGCMRPATLVGY